MEPFVCVGCGKTLIFGDNTLLDHTPEDQVKCPAHPNYEGQDPGYFKVWARKDAALTANK